MNKPQKTQRNQQFQEEVQRRKKRKQALLRIGLFSIVGILLLTSGYLVWSRKPDSSGKGTLRIAKAQYNFGVVRVRTGTVATEIPLVNIGDGEVLTQLGFKPQQALVVYANSDISAQKAKTLLAAMGFTGVVKTTFVLTNTSAKAVLLQAISTSCGCTSAEASEDVVRPGQTVSLVVSFDPNFHEEPAGKFSRTVFIQTSEGIELQAKISIQIKD